jgi:predicted nucleic acid-binding Zn ribbon protein
MKSCLECENYRSWGQKFCSDGCRNAYNNKINKDSTNFMRNINNKLRKITFYHLKYRGNQNHPS